MLTIPKKNKGFWVLQDCSSKNNFEVDGIIKGDKKSCVWSGKNLAKYYQRKLGDLTYHKIKEARRSQKEVVALKYLSPSC